MPGNCRLLVFCIGSAGAGAAGRVRLPVGPMEPPCPCIGEAVLIEEEAAGTCPTQLPKEGAAPGIMRRLLGDRDRPEAGEAPAFGAEAKRTGAPGEAMPNIGPCDLGGEADGLGSRL